MSHRVLSSRLTCLCGVVVMVLAWTSVAPAVAQDKYPSRPIECIVPWGPGGGADQLARKIAPGLEQEIKVSLPVLNVAGATPDAGASQDVVQILSATVCVTAWAKHAGWILRRFLQKNIPRSGPQRRGDAPRLPPLGRGLHLNHKAGARRSGGEARGETFPESALVLQRLGLGASLYRQLEIREMGH